MAYCVYCGGTTGTRDHVPSRVLLDEPYPDNISIVPACESCNNGLSLDEEYVACLIECTVTGSANAADIRRDKIKRILTAKPELTARLNQARQQAPNGVRFLIEPVRVRSVVMKLARGHVAYELNEPQFDEPMTISFKPLIYMTDEERDNFEQATSTIGMTGWPEVGSRAMQRLIEDYDESSGWIVVQPGRYRYQTSVDGGVTVRMVLSEYLACEVQWS